MLTSTVSLAVCTVFIRRVVDAITGAVPTLSQSSPHATALVLISGTFYLIYNQVKNGTLTCVADRSNTPVNRSIRLLPQRRSHTNSWFFRNLWGGKNKCANAICKLAKQSFDSVLNVNPCLLLPKKNFRICFSDLDVKQPESSHKQQSDKSCEVIFSNDSFKMNLRKGSERNKRKNSKVEIQQKPQRLSEKKPKKNQVKRLGKKQIKGMLNINESGTSKTRSGKIYNLNM